MSNAAELGAVEWEPEGAWAENVSTFANRAPVISTIDLSGLKQDKLEPGFLTQYLQGGSQHILGPQAGSFKTRFHFPGHGGVTSGAMAASALATLFSYAYGAITVGPTGSTFTGGGTAAAPVTTASGTFPAGGLCRGGVGGLSADARGNGAWAAISTHVGTALNLATAFDAPPANLDVLHSAVNLYIPESANDASTSVPGLRLRAVTPNLRYEMRGCYAMGLTIGGTNAGETMWGEIEWGVSSWKPTAGGAYPSAVASIQNLPSPIGNGGFFLADVGTSTRGATSKRNIRNFSVEIQLGIAPLVGHNGVDPYQTIVGAKRTPSKIKVRWVEDADAAATATPTLDAYFTGSTPKHALWEGSRTPGSAVAIYFRNLCIVGARPVQFADGGVNRIAVEAMAYTGPTSTSELTLAAMVLGLA